MISVAQIINTNMAIKKQKKQGNEQKWFSAIIIILKGLHKKCSGIFKVVREDASYL